MPHPTHADLKQRLTSYQRTVKSTTSSMAVAATAAWPVFIVSTNAALAPPVNTTTNPSVYVTFGNAAINGGVNIAVGGGTVNFSFYANAYSRIAIVQATFSGSNTTGMAGNTLVGSTYQIGAPGTSISFVPRFASYNGTAYVGNVFLPLRITNPAGTFYGWGKFGSFTGGFSLVAGTPILAGGGVVALTAVPEPTTALPLLVLGAAGVALNRRRKLRAA